MTAQASGTAIEAVDPLAIREQLRFVHREALGPGALSEEWAGRRLPAHARRRDFLFLAAYEGESVVGFGYGYTGAIGQWWTDRVAKAFTPAQRKKWLEPPHFEVVELHVLPSRQRRGIGTRILVELLRRQPHDRALLSTQAGSRQARSFYAKNGWSELATVLFGTGYPPYIVLGRTV